MLRTKMGEDKKAPQVQTLMNTSAMCCHNKVIHICSAISAQIMQFWWRYQGQLEAVSLQSQH